MRVHGWRVSLRMVRGDSAQMDSSGELSLGTWKFHSGTLKSHDFFSRALTLPLCAGVPVAFLLLQVRLHRHLLHWQQCRSDRGRVSLRQFAVVVPVLQHRQHVSQHWK